MARLIDAGTCVVEAGTCVIDTCVIDAGTCAATSTAVPLKQSSVRTSPRSKARMVARMLLPPQSACPRSHELSLPYKGQQDEHEGQGSVLLDRANSDIPAIDDWLTACTAIRQAGDGTTNAQLEVTLQRAAVVSPSVLLSLAWPIPPSNPQSTRRIPNDFGLSRQSAAPLRRGRSHSWDPAIDVTHKGDVLTIEADLPELKRDEVSVGDPEPDLQRRPRATTSAPRGCCGLFR